MSVHVLILATIPAQVIQAALKARSTTVNLLGRTVSIDANSGIFITMNPGYAGRTELPDNLKALMRPVAMMAPDLTMIAEVTLASEGFNEARIMAKKTMLYLLLCWNLIHDIFQFFLSNIF